MKLYLARHGRTNYNDLGLCNSDPAVDVHLTPTGLEQVERLADALEEKEFECIFVSQLTRTQQTADILNKSHGTPIHIDSRLNDNRTGFENKSAQAYRNALMQADDKWNARLNGGESIEDVKKRVTSFLDELRTRKYSAVLIVTSEIIIKIMCGILENLTNEQAWEVTVEQGSFKEMEV